MNKIKTSQAVGMPLAPVGNTIPTPTTLVSESGENRELDSGAKLKDARPYSVLFMEEHAAGHLDKFENANQVNRHLQGLKGAASPCTYFVNARSHGWTRVNGKWVPPTPEWLAANPFVSGTRISKAVGGMLSDEEVTAIKAQLAALELVPEAGKASVAPIVAGLQAKLTAHEAAVQEAAVSREKIENRRNALACVERILKALDSRGAPWTGELRACLGAMAVNARIEPEQQAACLFGFPERQVI